MSTVERNIAAMIEHTRPAHPGIVVRHGGPARRAGRPELHARLHRMLGQHADRYRVPLVPFFLTAIIGNDEWNLDDSLHPNAAGHRA